MSEVLDICDVPCPACEAEVGEVCWPTVSPMDRGYHVVRWRVLAETQEE